MDLDYPAEPYDSWEDFKKNCSFDPLNMPMCWGISRERQFGREVSLLTLIYIMPRKYNRTFGRSVNIEGVGLAEVKQFMDGFTKEAMSEWFDWD